MKRRLILQLSVATALFGLVLWQARFWRLPDAFDDAEWGYAAPAVLLNAPLVALWMVRSRFVLRALDHRLPLGSLFMISVVGNVAGNLTPGGIGDFLRIRPLQDRHQMSRASALGAVFYERIYLPALLAPSFATAIAIESLDADILATIAIVCLAVAVGAAFGALYPFASTTVRRIIPANWRGALSRHRALSWTADTDEVLSRLFSDLRLSAGFSAVTASVYTLTALQVVLALRAVGADVSLAEAWIAFAAATLTGLLMLLPAGLGAWDATMPAVLNSQGVDLLDATASTLLLRAIQTLPLGLLSIACYLALVRQRGGDQQTATAALDRSVGAD